MSIKFIDGGDFGKKQASDLTSPDPLAIYIHWPYCLSRCPYCSFNTFVSRIPIDETALLNSYKREIGTFAQMSSFRQVSSIFFGGGTPSLISVELIGSILDCLAQSWNITNDTEITLEANPSSSEQERFRGYRSAGVNRLSLGIQSFNDASLKFLGRNHSSAEASTALELAKSVFDRSSFDLISTLPHHDIDTWRRELREAIAVSAGHMSVYELTIEEGTRFYDMVKLGKLTELDLDTKRKIFDITLEEFERAGHPAYEISNFARPGLECRHNLSYWRYDEYVGIGPGAHSRIVYDGARHEIINEKQVQKWQDMIAERGDAFDTNESLTHDQEGDEMLLMGLRTVEGISRDRFRQLANRPLNEKRVRDLLDNGMIKLVGNDRITVPYSSWAMVDFIVADLAA